MPVGGPGCRLLEDEARGHASGTNDQAVCMYPVESSVNVRIPAACRQVCAGESPAIQRTRVGTPGYGG